MKDTVELPKEDRNYRENRQMCDFPTYLTGLNKGSGKRFSVNASPKAASTLLGAALGKC